MDTFFSILIAIGLAAACGFRIFVPPLVVGIADMLGWIDLASGMDWIGSPIAVTCFGIATVIEVAAYFIPAVNNLLDVIATPAAVIAGTVVGAGAIVDLPPLVQWTLAAIAAATVTGPIQVASASGRAATNVGTAGVGSPVFAILETIGSAVTAVLSVLIPIVAIGLVAALLGGAAWVFVRARRMLPARARQA